MNDMRNRWKRLTSTANEIALETGLPIESVAAILIEGTRARQAGKSFEESQQIMDMAIRRHVKERYSAKTANASQDPVHTREHGPLTALEG